MIKELSLSAFLVASVSGCNLQDNAQPIENCWSKDAKDTMHRMINESSGEFIVDEVRTASKGKITEDQKTSIKTRTQIVLDNFHAVSNFRDSGRLTCAMGIAFTFTKEGGATMHGKMMSEFDISKGEGGLIYSFNKLPINMMINSSKEDE